MPAGFKERIIIPAVSGFIAGISIYFLFSILNTGSYQKDLLRIAPDIARSDLFSGLLLNFLLINFLLLAWKKISGIKSISAVTFWSMAVLISLAEPVLRISGLISNGLLGSIVELIFIFQAYYIMSLSSFIFYRFRGLDGMLYFRLTEATTMVIMASLFC